MRSTVIRSDGSICVREEPARPMLQQSARVRVTRSLISTGTETDFIRSRRVHPAGDDFSPGYAAVGEIVQLSPDCPKGRVGQRAACAGWALATHSEEIVVPQNLFASVPDTVDDDNAAFVGCAVTCMHALRQAGVSCGESVAVFGAGLFGQITVRVARAFGARVLAVAKHPHQADMARSVCQETWTPAELEEALGKIVPADLADAVIIAAGGDQEDMIRQAGRLLRDRGTLVILGRGWARVDFREAMFQKELTLKNTRAYGPGRYDPVYEEQGIDYPIGYVRWTENRNMYAVLDLMARGRLDLRPLVTSRWSLQQIPEAYVALMARGNAQIAALVEYS